MLGRSLWFDTLALAVMALGFLVLAPLCVILCFGVTLFVTNLFGGVEVTFTVGMALFLSAVVFAAALAPLATRPVIDRLGARYFAGGGRHAA